MSTRDQLLHTRNIGIIAHIDAGKTTVSERILFYSGKIHRMGEVHDGTATMDWMIQEQQRGITITSAVTSFPWRECTVHLIDTPGHVDFSIEVERSLRVLDGAVVVFCAVGGVQPQSETVWHQADRYHVPRLAFVNKMDRPGANFNSVLDQMREKLAAIPLALQIPFFSGDRFEGVVDLVRMIGLVVHDDPLGLRVEEVPVPPEVQDEAAVARERLLETLADADDIIAERFLAGEEPSEAELRRAIRHATLGLHLVPVLCGAALRNKGIQALLDAICDYLPSPLDVPAITGHEPGSGRPLERHPSDQEPFCGLVFKVHMEEGRRMCFLRVYSGKVSVGDLVANSTQNLQERVARIFMMHSNKRTRLETAATGDIVGLMGLKDATTGDTLCDPAAPILLEQIGQYEPVVSMAVEPRRNVDLDKLQLTLRKLADEDPTFHVRTDEDTAQTVISGMGELHLDVMADRLRTEYGLEVNVGAPQVVYRETVGAAAETEAVFDHEVAGKPMYAAVSIRLEPLSRGEGNRVDLSAIESLAPVLRGAVESGLHDAFCGGTLQGFPVVDVKAVVIRVSSREGQSAEVAFKAATMNAVFSAMRMASPILLEPIMSLEVVVPEEFVGGVVGDVGARGGRVLGITPQKNLSVLEAQVPLSGLFGYARALRTLSQGRGVFSMQFSCFEEA